MRPVGSGGGGNVSVDGERNGSVDHRGIGHMRAMKGSSFCELSD